MNSRKLKRVFKSKPAIVILSIVLVAAGFGVTFALLPRTQTDVSQNTSKSRPKPVQAQDVPGLKLDTAKDYGDKYANGILPVGDGKHSSTSASKGTIYTCSQYEQNLAREIAGADSRGPWFTDDGQNYDINNKAHVDGKVAWAPQFSQTINSTGRTITTNDLPSHTTGVFPIASDDPAYLYDRNPNKVQTQSLTLNLPSAPKYGDPQCMGGEAGIMLTGAVLFNGFDAGGRDAGAWEVQDSCGGHPQVQGEYHYHTLSSCISDTNVSTIIGYALDGFPITGPRVGDKNILTTDDLDECHGIFSSLKIGGKSTMTYHYVMTQDFPYSVSCFRAAPNQIKDALHTRPQPGMQP